MVKRRRRLGWLLVGMGAVLLVAPIAMIGYGTWQESNLTRQWEAKLSTRARHVPTQPQAIPDAQLSVQTDPPPAGAVDFVLKIPRLRYAAAVREGVSSSVLEFGPGHYPTTPEPGQPGDVGVAAHNTYWLGFGAVKPGDRIVLETRDATTYTYVVSGARLVSEKKGAALLPARAQPEPTPPAHPPVAAARSTLYELALGAGVQVRLTW